MNTCARMESTSAPGRIQLSNETAKFLQKNGRGSWIKQREDSVEVKGKGQITTYWLKLGHLSTGKDPGASEKSASSPSEDVSSSQVGGLIDLPKGAQDAEKISRFVDWNVEVLEKLLRQIVVRRQSVARGSVRRIVHDRHVNAPNGEIPLEEVKEIIELPVYETEGEHKDQDPDSVKLPQEVSDQLRSFVACIGNLYHSNPFHSCRFR